MVRNLVTLSNCRRSIAAQGVLAAVSCLLAGFLRADPPEDEFPWLDAPMGFHLDRLGPKTVTVELERYRKVLHVASTRAQDRRADGTRSAPFSAVGQALAAAEPGARGGRVAILVAAGTYPEGPLVMKPGVDLFGGYSAETWQRDIFANAAILDGEGRERVLIGADDARIDGFVVQNGRVRSHGAGMALRRASPVVSNNIFRDNHTLEPEDFDHHTTRLRMRGHDGGAIALVDYANPEIKHNLFIGNTTQIGNGAAISMQTDCIPEIGYNVFWGNRSGVGDIKRSRTSNGGAISMLYSSRPAVMHNLFVENEALGRSDGGAVFCEYYSNPEIRNNVFLNNYAQDDSGAIEAQKYSLPKIYGNLMYGNHVDGSGGAVSEDEAAYDLVNNIIAHNTGKDPAAFGTHHGYMRVLNNTVVYNHAGAEDGAAVHHINAKSPFLKAPVIRNNIFWGNTPAQIKAESPVDFTYNIIEGGYPGYQNADRDPGFRDDGLTFGIAACERDAARFVSQFELPGAALDVDELAGRIARIGDTWTLVIGNGEASAWVWGLAACEKGAELVIYPTYRLHETSYALNRGIFSEFPPYDIDGDPRQPMNVDLGADEFVLEE